MHDTFKWNRELINQFFDSFPEDDLVQLAQRMDQFKQSKSPKPAPILTTVDGKELFEGDEFVVVDKDNSILGPIALTAGEKLQWEEVGTIHPTRATYNT